MLKIPLDHIIKVKKAQGTSQFPFPTSKFQGVHHVWKISRSIGKRASTDK